MRVLTPILFVGFAIPAFAVGTSEPATPPTPTETTTVCEAPKIWDEKSEECVAPDQASLEDDVLYDAARELAWAGETDRALGVLDAMSDQASDRVLTYRGFIARHAGDWDSAEALYLAALELNPDNLLARSYYGQGLAARGEYVLAKAQLSEIRARGGRQSWPEFALRQAVEIGTSPYY